MTKIAKSRGWHTTANSASGVAHFWEQQKYSHLRSLCGMTTEAKLIEAAPQTKSECFRCQKALAARQV